MGQVFAGGRGRGLVRDALQSATGETGVGRGVGHEKADTRRMRQSNIDRRDKIKAGRVAAHALALALARGKFGYFGTGEEGCC